MKNLSKVKNAKKLAFTASFAFILIAGMGVRFAAQNHYLCDKELGSETRDLEKQAKQFPRYPGASKYEIIGSCGLPDGTPNATIMFYTPDSKDKVFDYYTNVFAKQGVHIKTRTDDQLCATLCVNYDSRPDRYKQKWWNVDISL